MEISSSIVAALSSRAQTRGQNHVTVQDVARAVGVSKTTAASVLRNAPDFQVSAQTRQRVLDAAQSLGYRRHSVAAALSSGVTNTLGLLLPLPATDNHLPISRIYGQDIFVAVFHAANRCGLRVTAIPLPPGPHPVLQLRDVTDRAVDGLVIASFRDENFVHSVYAAGIPCVEIGSGFGPHLFHPDNAGGAELAVAHLAGLGHTRIAHWRGEGENYASIHRNQGFLNAMARRDLEVPEGFVAARREEIEALLRRPASLRPTAVFAYNDYQAFTTLDIARDLGIGVPDELSVVGFDDNILALAARPRLTSVVNPISEQADSAIRFLQTIWRGEPRRETPVAIATRLVIRDSTGPAPL